ncbi:MAG: chromate transporter [Tissierellia bacterium]|nr:chromate transporter [Tissierellia bacterium]
MGNMIVEFFKAGLFAIGGGLATLPFLQQMAMKYPWFTQEELLDMIAISESTPGAIGVNMATFSGYKAYGVLGSLLATLSLVLPSVIITIIISKFYDQYREQKIVETAFQGIRPCTAGLILGAMAPVFQMSFFPQTIQIPSLILLLLFLLILWLKPKVHPIFIIILGGIAGALFQL